MSDPHVFKVVRPYQTLEEFLEAEAAWLQSKTMLIVDAHELPVDTTVRFGIDLASGESVIRAEGKVIGYAHATDATPAGLKIRFKRYGASTKAVLERAKSVRAKTAQARSADQPDGAGDVAPAELESSPEANSVPLQAAPEPPQRDSGVRHRAVQPVEAPANRDELLERLRARARERSAEVRSVVARSARR